MIEASILQILCYNPAFAEIDAEMKEEWQSGLMLQS